jgi:hypothetical protein
MMHGRKNIELHNAEQAKPFYQYKNTKIKLYTNNAAIWYNKICRARQITPTYANIKMKGSIRSQPVYYADVYRERRYQMMCEYNLSS